MKYEYLSNVSVEKAVKDYVDVLREDGFCASTETVKTADALGRITAKAIYANIILKKGVI